MRKETKMFVGAILVAGLLFGNHGVGGVFVFGAIYMIFGED